MTTPELSSGASGGDIGNTTGPMNKKEDFSPTFSSEIAPTPNQLMN